MINIQGLERFLEELKSVVAEAKIVKADLEKAVKDLSKTKKDLKTVSEKVVKVEETTSKILEYSAMSDTEKNDLVKNIQEWKAGLALKAGDFVRIGVVAYEVIQDHTSQADWRPEATPALYKVYVPKTTETGEEVVADFKQPTGAHDAYKKGDKVMFEGKVYESLIENNAYSPTAYPAGWKLVE